MAGGRSGEGEGCSIGLSGVVRSSPLLGGSLSLSLARQLRPIILIVDGDCLGRLNDSKIEVGKVIKIFLA